MKDIKKYEEKSLLEIYGKYVSKLLEMKNSRNITFETFYEEVTFGKKWITYCEKNPTKISKEKCAEFLLNKYLKFLDDFHREYK